MSTRVPPEDVDRQSSTVIHEETAPMRRADIVTGHEVPVASRADHVAVDYGAERRAALNKLTGLVTFIFGVLIALITIRVLLRLIAANPQNDFAQFIYALTAPLVAPFNGLTGTPTYDGAALEISSIVAIIIYALVAWGLTRLLWLLFWRPSTTDSSTTTYHRG